eukprot:3775612-Ditylum_brightwellii.AAC.1
MSTTINDEKNTYSKPSPNAWSQGPPKTTQQKNPTGNKTTNPVNNTPSNNNSSLSKKSTILGNNNKELKQCNKESQKKYEKMLQSINAKLEQKENDQQSSI